MAKQRGVSLIELLIVVAIILILGAIAVVHFRHARIAANQASAVASLHAINTAQALYASTYPKAGFSPNLRQLGSNGSDCQSVTSSNACLLDPSIASGFKSGYIFDMLGDGNVPVGGYTATAVPADGVSGNCSFSTNATAQVTTLNQDGTGTWSPGSGASTSGCGQ
jgi:type IV pilus assembly protein PilA